MADQNINNMSVTWDSGGTTFDAVKMNVTDTASAAASLLQNFQVGGVAKFTVGKDGVVSSAGAIKPTVNDGAALGASGTAWADLFLASGGVINFNAGDVTITHSANLLAFGGASSGYTFDAVVKPSANDAAALGASGTAWSDAFFASGAVLNFNAGAYTVTQVGALLNFSADIQSRTYSGTGATAGVYIASGVINLSSTGAGSHTKAGFVNANGGVGSIVTLNSATTYNTASDGRRKKNLRDFDSGVFLDALEVWHFDWIAGGSGYGVIAQDAQKVFPDAITEGEDGFLLADYSKFVPLLIAEIKALRARVAELEG